MASVKAKVRTLDMRDKKKGVVAFVTVRGARREFSADNERLAVLGLRIELDASGIKEADVDWDEWDRYL